MTRLRCLVLGDDFTPAALFEDALRVALGTAAADAEFHGVDTAPSALTRARTDEVSEAFGDEAEIAVLARGRHLLVTTFAPVTARVLEAAPELLAVACGRGGPVNVNVDEATRRGVPVLFAPGRNAQAVAEYTVAAMMNLMRQVPDALAYARDGRWTTPREDTFEKPSGPELGSRTVGIVGCGLVGALVGRLVRAFGARVLGFDPYADAGSLATQGIRPVRLEQVLAESDVISLHARVAKGQPPLLGPAEFAAMRRRPYVLNTARAAALDYGALAEALAADRIAGAYLDVFPEEPIPAESPLLAVDPRRLHLTPHAAGVSRDIPDVTARMLAEGVAALLAGRRPAHVANPEALESARERARSLST
jgi:D-3-phosphoglycerate dehydrogenase